MWMHATMDLKAEPFNAADRAMLRNLARRVAEIAALPIQREREILCTAHNDLKTKQPVVFAFPEGAWTELIPLSSLQGTTPFTRHFETELRRRIYYDDHIRDDQPIRRELYVPYAGRFTTFGLEMRTTESTSERGSRHFDPIIRTMEDVEKMEPPRVEIDWDETRRREEIVQEALGDILDVQLQGMWRGNCIPIDVFAMYCGLDNLFYDMLDQPEMIHAAVRLMVDGWIDCVKELERIGALSLAHTNQFCASGGMSYTDDLPQPDFDGEHVRLKDLWGFATDQIFTDVSPAMHEEFAIEHEKRFLELFGLNSYGCCEPLHNKIEMLERHLPNLRRLSISPWADVEQCAEQLQDRYIYSWKPNPVILAGDRFEPEAVRESIRAFREKTRDCVPEIIMKDTHTVRHDPRRIPEWVRIAKEVCEETG
ncbi:hypothetical protein [Kiritimatiella glycovorans]|uniref:Uroporphyrinogen decarboxylase (URO-D) domain-containing protein n=1 Tax=Kiritimatiella glycovorans TaxID=1307763 RepID=A0A0G3ED17_9BACT|nr:hypothetical protein [Kiritimatiella glycovorans]AKJ64203.1 hypothetical protein L21SP4_00941 [Kiritimatiella glycovorans]